MKLLSYMKEQEIRDLLDEIDTYIVEYELSKENKRGYLALREDYNSGSKSNMKFYTLLCYAFNNQIRFNSSGDYNMPFGKDRSSFNSSLRQKFIDFVAELHKKDITFISKSFSDFNFSDLDSVDFVYADPPYYNSVASYNENNGWTEDNERDLLLLLDSLDCMHIKFALSNNLKYNNPLLNVWKEKYNVHYLNGDYSNCNYQKKDKSKDIEVLITNY